MVEVMGMETEVSKNFTIKSSVYQDEVWMYISHLVVQKDYSMVKLSYLIKTKARIYYIIIISFCI